MANRHKKHASGGKVVYSGAGSNVVKEAAEHKRGGKAEMKSPGGKGKSRYASGGRVGANKHPFSSAYVGPSGGGGK